MMVSANQTIAQFIYFAANTDIAVNYVLINSIVVISILTAFDLLNVLNSDFYRYFSETVQKSR